MNSYFQGYKHSFAMIFFFFFSFFSPYKNNLSKIGKYQATSLSIPADRGEITLCAISTEQSIKVSSGYRSSSPKSIN